MEISIKKYFKNISWLFLMQVTVYPIQLLIIPILIQRIGPIAYGQYITILALFGYLIAIVDYGMAISEQPSIVKLDFDSGRIRLQYIFGLKYLLVILIIFFGSLGYVLVPMIGYAFYLLPWLLYVVYSSDFMFLGLLWSKEHFFRTIIQKVVFVIPILVYEELTLDLILIWLGVSYFIALIYTMWVLKFRGYSLVPRFDRNVITDLIGNSSEYFVNGFVVNAMVSSNILMLNISGNVAFVALYGVLESIGRATQSLLSAVNGVLFPLAAKGRSTGATLKVMPYLVVMYSVGYMLLFLFRDLLLTFMGVDLYEPWLVGAILFIFWLDLFSKMYGFPILAAYGKEDAVNRSNLFGLFTYAFIAAISYFGGVYTIKITVLCHLVMVVAVLSYRLRVYLNNK